MVGTKRFQAVRGIGWCVMLLLALFIAYTASSYLTLDPQVFFSAQRKTFSANKIPLFVHVLGGIIALSLGPFQFIASWRRGRWGAVHRWLGRVYLVAVLLGGMAGLWLSTVAFGGWVNRLGFVSMALFWLVSGSLALQRIRTGNVGAHREWMMRNYAATFAAVTLRLWLILLLSSGVEFSMAYAIVAWLSWVPNLFLVEIWIQWQRYSIRVQQRTAPVATPSP